MNVCIRDEETLWLMISSFVDVVLMSNSFHAKTKSCFLSSCYNLGQASRDF